MSTLCAFGNPLKISVKQLFWGRWETLLATEKIDYNLGYAKCFVC